MKRQLQGVLLATLLASPAAAADLAVKAPPRAPAAAPILAPASGWSGFYIGGNAGGAWARDDVTWTANTAGFGAGAFTAALNAAGTGRMSPAGATAGGQIGYNLQLGSAVVGGIEADINYTDLSRSVTAAVAPPAAAGTTATSSFESKWLSTVRGRLGVLALPNLLVYGTGGAAIANVKTSDSAFFAQDGSTNAASSNTTRTGWTAGGGGELAFASNWTAKLEYLYVDLGTVASTSPNSATALATINHSHRVTENILRVGLNYRFGGPVVAKY